MCYDISFTSSIERLATYMPDLHLDEAVTENFEPSDHLQAQTFPQYPVILREDGILKCKLMEWGIVPNYWKTKEELAGRNNMANARSERVVQDVKSYWHRIRNQRCLVPVTNIYEHRKVKGWKKHVPYFIRLKHRQMFALPGLYHYGPIPGRGDEMIGTFTILTRSATNNLVMKEIHNTKPDDPRMVLFQKDKLHEEYWLTPDLSDAEADSYFKYELPAEVLDYHAVYTIRGGDRPDGKSKTETYEWEGLPALGEEDVQGRLF